MPDCVDTYSGAVQMFSNMDVSEELALNVIEANHADELFALVDRNRSHLRKWLPWLDFNNSVDDSLSFIQDSISLAEAKKGVVYEIRKKDNLIGTIGLNSIDTLHRICEVGYWVDGTNQGEGIATKCTRELVRFAFEQLEMNKVSISVATGNFASRAIPEKLGFTNEGVSRDAEWLYDHYVDHVQYTLLHREWETNQPD